MDKYVFASLDRSTVRTGYTNFAAGVYQLKYTLTLEEAENSFLHTVFGVDLSGRVANPEFVGSTRIGNDIFATVSELEDVRINDQQMFFDFQNQVHYVTPVDFKPLQITTEVFPGEALFFASDAQNDENGNPVESYYNQVFFEPRLIQGSVSISEQLDSQTLGLFIYPDISFAIYNQDGRYDTIRDRAVGNNVRIYTVDVPTSPEEASAAGIPYKTNIGFNDLILRRFGKIDDVNYQNPDEPLIQASDIRFQWNQKIGTNIITATEYPTAREGALGKRKPLAYGTRREIPAFRLEDVPDGLDSASIDFLICDTEDEPINSIASVYFDGSLFISSERVATSRLLEASEYTVNLATGIINIPNYISGNVYCSGTFINRFEVVDLVTFLLSKYVGLSYVSFNYNIAAVEAIRALGIETSIYISESGEDLNTTIEKLVSDAQLLFYQKATLLTMAQANVMSTPVEEVFPWQFFRSPPGWQNNSLDTIKTISVDYDQSLRTDETVTYFDNSRETDAVRAELTATDKPFFVNLTNRAQIESIYGTYYERFATVIRTVSVRTILPLLVAGLGDFIILPVTRVFSLFNEKEIFPRAIYRIVEINYITDTISLEYYQDADITAYVQGFLGGSFLGGSFLGGTTIGEQV